MANPDERRKDWMIGIVTAAAVAVATVLLVANPPIDWAWRLFAGDSRIDCDEYEFDADAWRNGDEMDDQAAGLDRCRVLIGMTRDEVRAMLGHFTVGHRPKARSNWRYAAGEVNDGLGPGDGQTLGVQFDRNGRVSATWLGYQPNGYNAYMGEAGPD